MDFLAFFFLRELDELDELDADGDSLLVQAGGEVDFLMSVFLHELDELDDGGEVDFLMSVFLRELDELDELGVDEDSLLISSMGRLCRMACHTMEPTRIIVSCM